MNEVTSNNKMKLSEHFSLGEFTKSEHPEVYNIPSHVAIENMKRICSRRVSKAPTGFTLPCARVVIAEK